MAIQSPIVGNVAGLRATQRRTLEKLQDRRIRQDVIVSPELATQLAAISRELNRIVGVLLDRRGTIVHVMLGDAIRLHLPDLGRARAGADRFRGLRLVRTALVGDPLTRDDHADLSKMRLDLVAAIQVLPDGHPGTVTWAHIIPTTPDGTSWRTQFARHPAELDLPFGAFIRDLENEFERRRDAGIATSDDAAFLVYVRTRDDRDARATLAEMRELARTAGLRIVDHQVQSRARLDPKFAVGKGALDEIEMKCLQLGADLIVFGQDLTPAQLRAISETTRLRVIDRTQLILDIFAQRAMSNVGKLQVELAQMRYRLPRLSGKGEAMSRLMGGIGGRGPGETKLEIDRRRVRERIRVLESRLRDVQAGRELRRKGRQDGRVPIVAIVGYTNAGKSTLLNTLTNSRVLAEDKLFATLDPTTRRMRFPEEREIVLTDTVGFIRDLPDELMEAFRATLEELLDADLLLHVIDVSDPDREDQRRSTERILEEIGVAELPRLLVYNKIDRLSPEALLDAQLQHEGVFLSSLDRDKTRPLIEAIDRWLILSGRGSAVPRETDWASLPEADEPEG